MDDALATVQKLSPEELDKDLVGRVSALPQSKRTDSAAVEQPLAAPEAVPVIGTNELVIKFTLELERCNREMMDAQELPKQMG